MKCLYSENYPLKKKANKRFTELSKNEETWISRDLKEPNNLPKIHYKMMHL